MWAMSKRTLLWLRGLDPLESTEIVTDYKPFVPSGIRRVNTARRKGKKCNV